MEFEKVSDSSLQTTANYSDTFQYVRETLLKAGGKLKKENLQDGLLEAAWRYGLNPFGLRVTIQFRTLDDNTIELNVKGGFKDSFDTTGAGQKKAMEIIRAIQGITAPEAADQPPRMGSDSVMNRGKSKVMAGILAVLLGGLGAHKFYIGSWGLGLAYLISSFVIPGLAMVIALVEGIRYFMLNENDFNEKYNYCQIKPFELKW